MIVTEMTREEQIKKALDLLRPADRSACIRLLTQALDDLELTGSHNQVLQHLYAKSSRKSLKAFRSVVDRARVARNGLPETMQASIDRLQLMRGQSPLDFDELLEDCDKMLSETYQKARLDYEKLNAAAWAWNIFGLLDRDDPPLTKGGEWASLAAILVGSDDDLFHYCSLYRKNSGQK
jgi:hypothetical protein